MLYRLFYSFTVTLVLIFIHGYSHSSDFSIQPHTSDILSGISTREQAVDYWRQNSLNSNVNRETVLKKFSRFTFDYEFLRENYFDVLNVNDLISSVFTKIYLNLNAVEEEKKLNFSNALAHSQIKNLSLRGKLTPELGKALVTVLNGGKKFQKLDMLGLKWDDFDSTTDSKYQMIKRIGMVAKGKVGELFIDQYYSTEHHPFNFETYDPEKEFDRDRMDKKLKEENSIWVEKIKQKQEVLDNNRVESFMAFVGIIFLSAMTVYSPQLAIFSCGLLMIALAIPVG